MKVIGIIETDRKYLCEVSQEEIEKYMNLFYNRMGKLKIGSELDLGEGYEFEQSCKNALDQTDQLIKANKKVVEAILNGVSLTSRIKKESSK